MNDKMEEQLKELFHGKFHKELSPRFSDQNKEERQGYRKKIVQYSKSVFEKFKPTVDPRKKAKVQQKIKELENLDNKQKRKVVQSDGSIVYEDKVELDHRKIGVSYLEMLKKDSEGRTPRNPENRSSSMMQLSKKTVKRIDYLR